MSEDAQASHTSQDRVVAGISERAQREHALVIDPDDGHRHTVVAAGDAVVGVVAGHSMTLALSSSSSCS